MLLLPQSTLVYMYIIHEYMSICYIRNMPTILCSSHYIKVIVSLTFVCFRVQPVSCTCEELVSPVQRHCLQHPKRLAVFGRPKGLLWSWHIRRGEKFTMHAWSSRPLGREAFAIIVVTWSLCSFVPFSVLRSPVMHWLLLWYYSRFGYKMEKFLVTFV